MPLVVVGLVVLLAHAAWAAPTHVRTGETYGSIAARTGHSVRRLQQLDPRLKATELWPGARVRLRK